MLGHTDDIANSDIEKIIIQAFGFSIIEFEKVLFHKFLISAGPASVMTEEQFHRHLVRMHAKGFVSPIEFQGMKGWKKLIISWTPDLEELEAAKEIVTESEFEKEKIPSMEGIVSESRLIANEILEELEEVVVPQFNENKQESLARYAEEMRKALSESQNHFIKYLSKNIPDLKNSMLDLLESKGEEVVLLSLRLIALR